MRFIQLVFLMTIGLTVNAQPLNYEVMAKQWVKLSSYKFIDERQFGTWFLQAYMTSTYNHVKNDEFELNDAIEDATQKAFAWLENVSADYTYEIITTVQVGNYDFKTLSFPLDFEVGSNFFHASSSPRGGLPGLAPGVSLHFNSIKNTNGLSLEMPKDSAKAFLASRKDSYGNINRNVQLKIRAKITSAEPVKVINYSNYMPLQSDIVLLEVYDQVSNKLLGKII